MWNWFKKDPLKRIGGAVILAAAVLLLLKISAFVGTLLFKIIFLVAIGAGAYLGYKKLMAKMKGGTATTTLVQDNSKVRSTKSRQKS